MPIRESREIRVIGSGRTYVCSCSCDCEVVLETSVLGCFSGKPEILKQSDASLLCERVYASWESGGSSRGNGAVRSKAFLFRPVLL